MGVGCLFDLMKNSLRNPIAVIMPHCIKFPKIS